MEVHATQPGGLNPNERRFERLSGDLQDADRLRTRRARREISRSAFDKDESGAIVREARPHPGAAGDVLDVPADRHLDEVDPARAHRIDELRRAHADGKLNTPDRIGKAAEGILRG